MSRYFIQLAYKGTAYHGWQIQENTPMTVQQVLNEKLSLVLNESIELTGCGRTDTGVHASCFYAHFDSSKHQLSEDADKWIHKFNSVLPADIAVYELFMVTPEANSRFDALSRTYRYQITRSKDPFRIDSTYLIHTSPNIQAMNEAAKILFHHRDFSCFSKSNTQTFTNNCLISFAEWTQEGDLLVFTITADRFLRNMVRAIVGTLLNVGEGKLSLEEFESILLSKDRSKAGFSVPAAGLFLTDVRYSMDKIKLKG